MRDVHNIYYESDGPCMCPICASVKAILSVEQIVASQRFNGTKTRRQSVKGLLGIGNVGAMSASGWLIEITCLKTVH